MAHIFLSYRRDDSAYVAATLNEKLQDRFGSEAVFFDVDAIPLGVDFREFIAGAVGRCDVLLVLIGDNWLQATDGQSAGRLDDPADYVRIEIESALKRDIPVIPVLVGEAPMPAMTALPPSIQSIVFRNAAEIRAGRDFRQHMDRLIQALDAMLASNAPAETPTATSEAAAEIPEPVAEDKPPPKRTGKEAARRNPALQRVIDSLDGFTDSRVFLAGNIPALKLDGAIETYAEDIKKGDVLLLYDNTVLGGAQDGLLLTADAVYWRNMAEDPEHVRYADIKTVRSLTYIFSANVSVNGKNINVQMGKNKAIAAALAKVIQHMRDP